MVMGASMGKALLDVVNDFASWRGNPFTLAQLIAEGMPEAAEKV